MGLRRLVKLRPQTAVPGGKKGSLGRQKYLLCWPLCLAPNLVWFVFRAMYVLSGNTHNWGQWYEIGVQKEALRRLWHLASQEVWKWSQVNCLAWLYEPKHKPRHWNWLYTHEKKIHKMIHKVLVTSRSWRQNMLLGLVLPWLNSTTEHRARPRSGLHQINSWAQVTAPFSCALTSKASLKPPGKAVADYMNAGFIALKAGAKGAIAAHKRKVNGIKWD